MLNVAIIVAGGGTGILAFASGVSLVLAAVLAVAVVVVCAAVASALTVSVPQVEAKPKKPKHEKPIRTLSSPEDMLTSTTGPRDNSSSEPTKADKRREKERAKKAARKDQEEKQRVREAAEERLAAEQAARAAEAVRAAEAARVAEAAERERLAAEAARLAQETVNEASGEKKKKKKKKKVSEEPAREEKKGTTVVPATGSTKTAVGVAPVTPAVVALPPLVTIKQESETKMPPVQEWEEVKGAKKGKMKDHIVDASVPDKVEVEIDSRAYGVIIGKNKQTLKAITDATQTLIEIPKEGEMGKVLVSGPAAGIAKAITAMQQLAAKGHAELISGKKEQGSIMIPPNKRAALIGRGGETIRIIQDKFKVRLNLPKEDNAPLTVLGDEAEVQEALRCINDLIEKGFSEATHPGFVASIMEVPSSQLSKIIGREGTTIKELQGTYGVRINVAGTSVTLLGLAVNVAEAKAKILELIGPSDVVIDPEWTQEASSRFVDLW